MFNPIKPTLKTEILPIIILVIAILSSFYFYAHFPEQAPIHWNAAGEPDRWGSAAFAAFFFPGIIFILYLLLLFLPKIDPKKNHYEQFVKTYHIFKFFIILVMAAIYFIASFNALGYDIKIAVWIPAIIGALFIVIGSYMSRIKSNWFIGIRTPWTLSSEKVWDKTHRFGGKMFILAGILLIFQILMPISFRVPALLTIVISLALIVFIYSYFAYAKENKKK